MTKNIKKKKKKEKKDFSHVFFQYFKAMLFKLNMNLIKQKKIK